MEVNEEVVQDLHQKPTFKYFALDDLRELVSRGEVLTFFEGSTIITEGQHSQDLFIVISGCVNVMVNEETKNVFISAIGEGEFFGEAGIFSKVKRTASVTATEGTTILKMTRQKFLEFLRVSPSSGMKFLMIIIYSLLKKLREVNQELAFERKFDIGQEDIDSVIQGIMEST